MTMDYDGEEDLNPPYTHEPEHLDGGAVTINAQRAWHYTADTGEL